MRLSALKVADAYFHLSFDNLSQQFIAEYKPAWDERTFQSALERTLGYANDLSGNNNGKVAPLIVLPYLSDERLAELERRKISGIDLCGNGIIFSPGRFYIRATGNPNRFRIEQAIRNPYSGKAALVGRTLLRRPLYRKLEDLREEILRRGGDISLAMVSRTIQILESENLITSYWEDKIRLYSPSRLQTRLIEGYRPKSPTLLWRGNVTEPMTQFLSRVFRNAAAQNIPCIVTGAFSASRYVSLGQTLPVTLYAEAQGELLAGLEAKEGKRFVDLEIYAPPDDNVFFDGERDENGILWSSPVQALLEISKIEDVRLQETAVALRNRIMENVNSYFDKRGG